MAHEGPHLWSRGCGVHRRVLAASVRVRSGRRGTVPLLVVGGYKIDVRGAALEVLRRMGLYDAVEAAGAMQGAVLVDRDGNEIGRMTGDDFGHRGGDDLEIVRGSSAGSSSRPARTSRRSTARRWRRSTSPRMGSGSPWPAVMFATSTSWSARTVFTPPCAGWSSATSPRACATSACTCACSPSQTCWSWTGWMQYSNAAGWRRSGRLATTPRPKPLSGSRAEGRRSTSATEPIRRPRFAPPTREWAGRSPGSSTRCHGQPTGTSTSPRRSTCRAGPSGAWPWPAMRVLRLADVRPRLEPRHPRRLRAGR